MADVQPRVRNRAATTRPFSTRAANFITSPQTGFSNSTVAVASGNSPTLRGCSK